MIIIVEKVYFDIPTDDLELSRNKFLDKINRLSRCDQVKIKILGSLIVQLNNIKKIEQNYHNKDITKKNTDLSTINNALSSMLQHFGYQIKENNFENHKTIILELEQLLPPCKKHQKNKKIFQLSR